MGRNVQLRNGKVHYSTTPEGFMPGPACGGNKGVEGYRVVTAEVNCKNCLKIMTAPAPAEVESNEGESMPEESKETEAVSTALMADKTGTMEPVGYSLPLDSLESFTERAKAWLSGNSELSTATIDNADYAVPFEFFKGADETGETMAQAKADVTTDEGAKVVEQIDANIERAGSLAEAENAEGLEELGKETEALISSLSGKGSIATKKAKRDAFKAAAEAAPKPAPKEGVIASLETQDYRKAEGVSELLTMGAERFSEGVRTHLKSSQLSKDIARIILDMRTRISTKEGLPDLKANSRAAKDAARDMYQAAGEHFAKGDEVDNFDAEEAIKRLVKSVQNIMSDVSAEYLKSLDTDQKEAARYAGIISAAPEGTPASKAVADHYGLSLKGRYELAREAYQAKKELEAAQSESDASEEGEGEGAGTEAAAPVDPDKYLEDLAQRLTRVTKGVKLDVIDGASEEVKASMKELLEAEVKTLREIIARTV